MAIGKLTTGSKIKPGPLNNKKNHKNSYELILIRPQTQHKSPEHMYLKFLTPLIMSGENCKTFSRVHVSL